MTTTASRKQKAVSSKTTQRPVPRVVRFLCLLFVWLVPSVLLVTAIAEAQQPRQLARIGFLSGSTSSAAEPRLDAFRQGLRQLGYFEGKHIVIEQRYADGKPERLPGLAAELVRLKVDIVVTTGALPTRAAKEATSRIPIVMTQDVDPVGSGFITSLSRPGGNITGMSSLSADISGKRLELLREIVPAVHHVAVLGTSTVPGTASALQEIERAAGLLAMKLQFYDVVSPKHIDTELEALSERAVAVLVLQSLVLNSHRKRIADHMLKRRLPAMYYAPEWVEDGGLMTYGVSFIDLYRRAATYVDKILKGTKPADLPVEQPTKFELVINLKTAKQIGVTIPDAVLFRADKVIR